MCFLFIFVTRKVLEIGWESSLDSKFKIWKSCHFPDFGSTFQKKGTFLPVIACTYTLVISGHSRFIAIRCHVHVEVRIRNEPDVRSSVESTIPQETR